MKRMLITAYNDYGPGSDWKHFKPQKGIGPPSSVGPGTVAVSNSKPKPYPYGASVTVYGEHETEYGPHNKPDYTGEVHDTGAGWDSKHHNVKADEWIDIWLPGRTANQWGKQWRMVEICWEEEGGCEK